MTGNSFRRYGPLIFHGTRERKHRDRAASKGQNHRAGSGSMSTETTLRGFKIASANPAKPGWQSASCWERHVRDQRQHSRDIVQYSDKLPKLPLLGSRPISHLDLRSRGSRTIQTDGFETLADAMNADPVEIVHRSLYFTDVDIRPHAEAEAIATHEHFSWRLQSRRRPEEVRGRRVGPTARQSSEVDR